MRGSDVLAFVRCLKLDALVGQPVRIELGEVGVVRLGEDLVVTAITFHEGFVLSGLVGISLQPLLQLLGVRLPNAFELADGSKDAILASQLFDC